MESVFYFEKDKGGSFIVPKEEIHHIEVLRIKLPSCIKFTDGEGSLYSCMMEQDYSISRVRQIDIQNEQSINVLFGICEKSRMKLILEKCTELGVKSFVPLFTEKSSSYPFSADKAEAVIKAAAKQSRRYFIPKYNEPVRLSELEGLYLDNSCYGAVADESNSGNLISAVNVFIGPPSGFTENEEKMLIDRGALPVHLDTGILRTETFAISIISIIHYLRGKNE